MRPFVGRYRNEALGEVRVALNGNALTLNAGEFSTELRPIFNGAGRPDGYIFFDAPLAGLPPKLQREEGRPVLVVGGGAVSYTFTRF